MKKKTICIFIFLMILLLACNSASAEEKYFPYPIVFVHGLGDNYIRTWTGTSHYFYENYFEDKYFIDNYSYLFPPCNYSPANMDLSQYPVTKLKAAIDRGIDKGFLPDYNGERKVIVVAHSMGGLVLRALLKQDSSYQNKISRVVFLGTPHKGSPVASIYWMVNEETQKLNGKIRDNAMYAENALGHLSLGKYLCYQGLLANMRLTRKINSFLLNRIQELMTIKPYDIALKQLRVPADVTSQITFTDGRLQPLVSEVIIVGHKANGNNQNGQNDTKIVTYGKHAMLATPEYFSILKGTGGTIVGTLIEILSNLQLSRTYSGFPSGNTLSDLAAGDGVVTQDSQTALEGSSRIISKYVWHLSEPNERKAILDLIDDSPVIEDMYVVRWPIAFPVYIIIKVKDYLLADIEIASITVDGIPVDLALDLAEFDDGEGHYKPYVKFGKDFLKEREDPNVLDPYRNPITLSPGEFYIPLYLDMYTPHIVDIELKNPSNNPPVQKSLILPIIKKAGFWDLNVDTGNYEGYRSYGGPHYPFPHFSVGGYYRYAESVDGNIFSRYSSAGGSLHKIEIPETTSPIDNIYVLFVGGLENVIEYYLHPEPTGDPNTDPPPLIEPDAYPLNTGVKLNIDYSFNSLANRPTPIGEYNLLRDEQTDSQFREHGIRRYWTTLVGYKKITTSFIREPMIEVIPVNSQDIEAVWISIYHNIRSLKAQIETHATATLANRLLEGYGYGWSVHGHGNYYVYGIYGHTAIEDEE